MCSRSDEYGTAKFLWVGYETAALGTLSRRWTSRQEDVPGGARNWIPSAAGMTMPHGIIQQMWVEIRTFRVTGGFDKCLGGEVAP